MILLSLTLIETFTHKYNCQFSRTSELKRIQEINDNNSIRPKFEEHACASVFLFSCPKVYNSLKPIKVGFAKPKKGTGQKDNTFVQAKIFAENTS